MNTDDDDFHSYYQSRSKQESVAMAAWCAIAIFILLALAGIHWILQ